MQAHARVWILLEANQKKNKKLSFMIRISFDDICVRSQGLPMLHQSFQNMFMCLDVDSVTTVFAALLMERKILIRSKVGQDRA